MLRIRVRQKTDRRGESGYLLLVLMIAVAMLTIAALGVARNYRRSIQRDREVEMIHRGEQYARAVKRYYKKLGRYPTTIEQLEDTNKIRFLRKKYKDPMSPDGQWKLVHATDVKLPGIGGAPGIGGTSAGVAGTANSGALAGTTSGTASGAQPSQPTSTDAGSNAIGTTQSTDGTTLGNTTGTSTSSGSSTQGGTGSTGPTGTGNAADQVLGGGDMFGVVSKMKTEGIHSFGDKTKYNEWFFIYVPAQDTGKGLLTGPYNPKMFIGAANSGLGNSNKTGSTSGTGTTTGSPTTNPASPTTSPTTPTTTP